MNFSQADQELILDEVESLLENQIPAAQDRAALAKLMNSDYNTSRHEYAEIASRLNS